MYLCRCSPHALLPRFHRGGIFPSGTVLAVQWYTREELGLRVALLYCGNIISNAFGALLASGILDGMQRKAGTCCMEVGLLREVAPFKIDFDSLSYRWLFYIEGALTIAVAITAIFILPDFLQQVDGCPPWSEIWLCVEWKKTSELANRTRRKQRSTSLPGFGWQSATGKSGG